MTTDRSLNIISKLLLALAFTASAHAAVTDISTVPLNTYSAPSSTDVKPNIFFVLDDSGSMDWDFMPDWACASYSTRNSSCSSTGQDPSSARSEFLFKNASYNGVYYNPALTYKPPVAVDSSGATNTTTYPSMTGTSAATGGSNWSAVKNDAYGVQSTSTSDLLGGNTPPYFFTIAAGEYCNSTSLITCVTASTPSASYPYPAKVRWCDSTLANCSAAFSSTNSYVRAPSPRTATITVGGSSSTSVSGITINGSQIMSGTASASGSSSTVAQNIAAQINLCTVSIAGSNCQVVGYTASNSGNIVTITAPGAISYTPVVTKGNSGTMTFSATAFSVGAVPGDNLRTTITSSVTSYPYPGTSAKASARTDCAGTTCTYQEEMTNYANWWTYYRTRMQMMKSAESNAVSKIDTATDIGNNVSRFRLGFMSINNNTGSDFINLAEFKTTQKYNWYTKLISAKPGNSTPLRAALATAGQFYAGKLNGTALNGGTVTDPLQYSCQQNYTILSTDGFWNESSGFTKMDGSTNVGNQDAALPRPYFDGGSAQIQTKTSALQSQTVTSQAQSITSTLQQQPITIQPTISTDSPQQQITTIQPLISTDSPQQQITTIQPLISTSTLQQQTSQLQATTNLYLQSATKNSSSGSYTFADAPSCTYQTSSYPKTKCQYRTGTLKTTAVSSCTVGTPTTSTTAGTVYNPNVITGCSTVVTTSYANVSSCTVKATPDASGFTTQCRYTPWTTPTNTATPTTPCTANPQSTASPYSVGTAIQCSTSSTTGAWTNVSPCTTSSTSFSISACRYNPQWTTPTPTATPTTPCTANPQSTASPYITATQCSTSTTTGAWTDVPSCATSSTSFSVSNCRYNSQWTAFTATASPTTSCTANPQSTASPYVTATQCSSVSIPGTWANATSACTTSSTSNCRYTAWTTTYTNTPSCTATPQSTTSPYQNLVAYQCRSLPVLGTWTNASSCTQSSTSNCQYTGWTSWSNTSSCTAVAQSTSPNYTAGTATQCQTLTSGGTSNTLADVAAYYYNTDLRSPVAANGTGTCTGPTIAPATTPNDLCADNVPANGRDVATTQHMTTFTLGLGSQGQMIYAPNDGKNYWNDTIGDFFDVKNGTTANPSSGICSWQTSGACNWPTPSSNSNANIDDLWHAAINGHGTYFSATDPSSLSAGLTNALSTIANTPRPGTAAAAASSNPNVSASNNYVFSSSYESVAWYGELIRQQINATTGALTAQNWSAMRLLDCATTTWAASTSYIIGGVYKQGSTCYTVTSAYTSGTSFDSTSTGVDLSNTAVVNVDEAATVKVPAVPLTARTIYTKDTTKVAPTLLPFQWSSLSATQQAYFTAPAITYASATAGLSQFCSSGGNCLSSTAQSNNTIATGGAAGEALVNFLRGDRSKETTYFRQRTHVLGDIVSSEARYVQTPLFNYSDANYSAFSTSMASRSSAVYVGANDGMLHAFDATSGQELWAYIPSIVLPNLYKLADTNYTSQHQYFVDNSPEVGDICPNAPTSTCASTEWKTILVGGLNRGGQGYYALDITNPATPKLLWEYTDTNLGYTYGNPKITKLQDGTWVVLVSSGYNNADGVGRLYVLNANTGALIRTISTGVGSATSPSGIARISAHALLPSTDNTTVAAYGGDTFGNLWRFSINGNIGTSGYNAQLLISFKDASGNAQPITVAPLEATINNNPVVFAGTGQYLGTTDVTNTNIQSFYAVMDKLDTTTYGNPRTVSNNFVQQVLTSGTCPTGASTAVCTPGQVVRTSTAHTVDWTTQNGWYVDFLTGGERSSSDPALGLGTLMFTTITPQSSSVSACGAGSSTSASFAYSLNYLTGGAVDGTSSVSGISLGSGLVTRPILIELSDGTVRALIRSSGGTSLGASTGTDLGTTDDLTVNIKPPSNSTARRVSWRELTTK